METIAERNDVRRGDALAGMLRASATLVHDEPTLAGFDWLAGSGLFDALPEGLDDVCLENGFDLLGRDLREHKGDPGHVLALQREWLRLFAGVGMPQVPSWANYYLDPESRVLGRETLAVRALYRKHGLQVERAGAEPDDDLGLILRFVAHLLELGEAGGRADAAELLGGHVLPWISRWHYFGLRHASSAFYRGAVEFVFGVVRSTAFDLGFSYRESTRSFVQRKETK